MLLQPTAEGMPRSKALKSAIDVTPVKLRPRAFDLDAVINGPFAERFDRLLQTVPEIGQFIINARCHSREYGSRDQTIPLEAA